MSDRFNALRIQPPPEARTNMLAGPPQPDWAGATDENIRLYNDFIARDRQRQIDLGYVDPTTGQLTPEGWRQQAQNIAGGFGPADVGMAGGFGGLIKNYHGSPHLFPPTPKNPLGEFNMSKIGTGEGSQVFGQGMYTADVPGTAGTYKDRADLIMKYDGTPLNMHAADSNNQFAPGAVNNIEMLVNRGMTPAEALASTTADSRRIANASAARGMPRMAEHHGGTADWLETLDPSKLTADKGHMYEVNIHAEPGDFLHWDKPISKQSPQVQEQVRSIVPPVPDGVSRLDTGRWVTTLGGQPVGRPDGWPDMSTAQYALKAMREETPVQNMTGADIHRYLAQSFGSNDAAAAEALRNAGIPGIRYLDRGSRGGDPDAPGATHNHVVFDPDKMEIIRRYGIAGLMAGGAAATAAGGQDQGNQ